MRLSAMKPSDPDSARFVSRGPPGRTALIEVNDGFSFGCYGPNAHDHARMLEARGREMVGLSEP